MEVAIYGTGVFGKLFYQALGSQINFFIDDFSNEFKCFNKKIHRIDTIQKNTKIYISILQHSAKIEKYLQKNGFTNIINFTNSIKTIPDILKLISKQNYLWLIENRSKMINEKQLALVTNLLKDDKSKDILQRIILLRKTFDTQYYIEPEGIEYFPTDVPIFKNLDTVHFIDCGAYNGDTITELLIQAPHVSQTISFEPDKTNFEMLKKQIALLKVNHPNTSFLLYPSGLFSKNTILKFSNNGINSSATIDNSSTVDISVVTIDSVLLNSHPNFIKMDIEGAEKEAILGSIQTIKKYKPNLAICLYHKAEDLWELPLLIHKIESSYDMYLRVHEDLCLSTVLYCIAKENKNL